MKPAYLKEKQAKLFVISGPSGVGRTTIIKSISKDLDNISFSVSYTTREKRRGEKNHQDYHFVSEEAFKKLIGKGELLEWAKVFKHYYGTPKGEIEKKLKSGKDVILDIDIQGANQLRKKAHKIGPVVFIFLAPPSEAELKMRLKKRGTEDRAQLKLRLKEASKEMEHIPKFDYLVINDRLKDAVRYVKSIVLAERCKLDHRFKKQNAH